MDAKAQEGVYDRLVSKALGKRFNGKVLAMPWYYLLITCSLTEVTIQLDGLLMTRVACTENASQNRLWEDGELSRLRPEVRSKCRC